MSNALARRVVLLLTVVAVLAASAPLVRAGRAEFAALPDAVQEALAAGHVVLLEGLAADRSISATVVAVVPVPPGEVVDEIRSYKDMGRLVRGLRSLTIDRGDNFDTYTVEVKPHALLPLMELEKQLTVASGAGGDMTVDVELVKSSYARIESQSAEWQLLKLSESSTLVIFKTRECYRSLPFRNRVLTKVTDGCQALVDDVQARCTRRADARLAPTVPARAGF